MTDKELLENMKILHLDHAPDGWPSVRMSDISQLLDIIDRQALALSGKTQFDAVAETAERCRKIAWSQIPAPPGAWGQGASFNALKIARLIKEEYGLSD